MRAITENFIIFHVFNFVLDEFVAILTHMQLHVAND